MPRVSNCGRQGVRYEPARAKFRVTLTDPVTHRTEHGGYYDAPCSTTCTVETCSLWRYLRRLTPALVGPPGACEYLDRAAREYDWRAVELYGSPGAVPHLNFPRAASEAAAKRKTAAARGAKVATADGATRASG
jgi:hypothetical protein